MGKTCYHWLNRCRLAYPLTKGEVRSAQSRVRDAADLEAVLEKCVNVAGREVLKFALQVGLCSLHSACDANVRAVAPAVVSSLTEHARYFVVPSNSQEEACTVPLGSICSLDAQ